MKKVVTGAAIIASLFLLVGCGKGNSTSTKSSSSTTQASSSKKSALKTAEMDVNATFTNGKEDALVKGTTASDVKEIQKEVASLPDSDAKNTLTTRINKAVKLINKKDSAVGKTAKLFDGTSITFTGQQVYKTNTSDSSFLGSRFTVKGVSVNTTEDYKYEGGTHSFTGNGIIMLKYSYTAGDTDLNPILIDSTISTNSGTQSDVDTMDSNVIDNLDSGVTKTGVLVFPMQNLNKVSDVTSVRLKFTCYPQDDNSDKTKDYDITIPLN